MRIKLSLFFACCLFFACNRNTEIHFPLEKSVVFKEMNVGNKLGRVLQLKAKEEYIFVCEKNADTQLQLFNKQTYEIFL